MRHFLLLVFFAVAINLSSQSFTNGSVFNYAIGDTIVTSYIYYAQGYNTYGPPTFRYRVFNSKYYSQNADTVFYGVHDFYYTPGPCGGCIAASSQTITSFYVTNFMTPVVGDSSSMWSGCQYLNYNQYVDGCGSHVLEKTAYSYDSLFCDEMPYLKIQIVEGVGVFFETRSLKSSPTGIGEKSGLSAYHKVTQNCGSIGIIPDGINERGLTVRKLETYPNPSTGHFTLNIQEEGWFVVQNLLGEEILKKEIMPGKNSVDLSEYSPGVYMVKCFAGNKIYTGKLVKD